jgi:para-aminobenzoate synthetase/4-amino-4-deoxychorismate lyase
MAAQTRAPRGSGGVRSSEGGRRCIASARPLRGLHPPSQGSRMADRSQPDPAQGVFETLLVVSGVPLELDAHLERLGGSVRALYDAAAPAGARELALARAAGLALGRLRLSLAPPVTAPGALRAEATAQPLDRATVLPGWKLALDLRSAPVEGWNGAHKWADRRLLERLDAGAAPESALLVDRERGALETTRANLFAVGDDGVLRTPPLDGAVLPGLTRARVLALARGAGVEVREERLPLERLLAARELFATGSVRGVEPIRSLDGIVLDGPGPVTAALARELRLRWLGDPAAT